MATLLSHRGTQTFEDLVKDVPAYASGKPDSIKRTFERDKGELRELGIPIETIGNDGDDDTAYRLRPKDFYLPYLALVSERGRSRPVKVDKYGYRAIGELAFDSDELAAVAEAAIRVRQLGDADLAAHANSAMRKLAFDLPVDSALAASPDTIIRQPRAAADSETLRTLNRALVTRKRVTIEYESMSSNRGEARVIEPFGLFFMNAHWYLVGREVGSATIRNYRVNRIASTKVNASKLQTPDYEIPTDFRLRDHARSRPAWELGDGDSIVAEVQVRGTSGATIAAAELGVSVKAAKDRRSFTVRRSDVFARWCLSFAGEIVPVSPESIVQEYDRQRAATLALYQR